MHGAGAGGARGGGGPGELCAEFGGAEESVPGGVAKFVPGTQVALLGAAFSSFASPFFKMGKGDAKHEYAERADKQEVGPVNDGIVGGRDHDAAGFCMAAVKIHCNEGKQRGGNGEGLEPIPNSRDARCSIGRCFATKHSE